MSKLTQSILDYKIGECMVEHSKTMWDGGPNYRPNMVDSSRNFQAILERHGLRIHAVDAKVRMFYKDHLVLLVAGAWANESITESRAREICEELDLNFAQVQEQHKAESDPDFKEVAPRHTDDMNDLILRGLAAQEDVTHPYPWEAAPAAPDKGLEAQIFDNNGLSVVELRANDDGTEAAARIVKAHNQAVSRMMIFYDGKIVELTATASMADSYGGAIDAVRQSLPEDCRSIPFIDDAVRETMAAKDRLIQELRVANNALKDQRAAARALADERGLLLEAAGKQLLGEQTAKNEARLEAAHEARRYVEAALDRASGDEVWRKVMGK